MGKTSRERTKECDSCGLASHELFRVRYSGSADWELFCKRCQTAVKHQDGYQYGGTWKSVKRH